MVIKTYFDKSNTITYDSDLNVGLNPFTELIYGDKYSRFLLHFDLSKIREMFCDGMFSDVKKLKHTLHMSNSASINGVDKYNMLYGTNNRNKFQRATSFELIIFRVPQYWDGGKGYNYSSDVFLGKNGQTSNQGSNWFQSCTGVQWGNLKLGKFKHSEPDDVPHNFYNGLCDGIYDNEFLMSEYQKYYNNEDSIIITTQKFDIGNENLEMDLTDIVNKMLVNEKLYKNNGFAITFAPYYENIKVKPHQYCGFFTQNTSSFFEPYLETRYECYINDDRNDFYLDKENKLYLYCFIGEELQNLDVLPKCRIYGDYENGEAYCKEYPVKQCTKGIYYIDVLLPSYQNDDKIISDNRMFYDEWSDIIFKNENGMKVRLSPIKQEFVTKSPNLYYNFTNYNVVPQKYSVNISGIKMGEQMKRGDIRKIIVDSRIMYTSNQSDLKSTMEYRLYVYNGVEELQIIDYEPIEHAVNHNYFMLDTNSLLPNKYFIDVRTISNGEIIIHEK